VTAVVAIVYDLEMLEPAAIEAFETDGVVAVRGLLDPACIDSPIEAMPALLPRAYDPVVKMGGEPGRVLHPGALHTGYGSSPDQPRRTFTIRFMGDDVCWRRRRDYFHGWMRDCGLEKGAVIDHEGFPVVWSADLAGARDC
jgi:hypothetical protein